MLKQISDILVRRSSVTRVQCLTTATQPKTEDSPRLQIFRTSENDPTKHTTDHIGQYYKISDADKKQLFLHGGIPNLYVQQTKTFNETCLMVREPSLDIINCLKNIDYSKPPVRFVLYGKKGTGKSLTMAHVLHYALKDKFLIVHVPWVGNWMRRCKESSNSETKEGCTDLNLDAAAWLLHFKTQNTHLLSNPDLKTSVDHIWTKREKTNAGSPILELIEHGINRVKFASDTVVILAEEIKKLAESGVCKTLVAVDGFNAFFYPKTRVYTEKKEVVHPHKVTLTPAFLSLSQFDWKNSAIVLTVDEIAAGSDDQASHLPRYLLGKDGFEHLDPFVPIPVKEYSAKEFKSCMDYFRDRRWITEYPGQDEEISFLSSQNPYSVMQICAGL